MNPKPGEPTTFGRYQLIEKLAVGGMAEIFKAKSMGVHGFEKTLVIKRILPHLARNKEFVGMFIEEAKVMTRLNHPKIVQVLDFGEEGGQMYIVMEFVQGMDCLAMLRYCAHHRCRPTTGIAVHIVSEVLDALDYAHKLTDDDGKPLGIMHRDISPSNIFISDLGEVKLGDFGIAVSVQSKAGSKQLKGKYGYMAPEAVSEGVVDARAEVFVIGIVLAELLMIRRLFIARRELEVLFQVRDAKINRLDKYGKHIPGELRQVLESAMARNPANRYQDAATFRDALHRYLFDNRLMVRNTDVRRFLDRLRRKNAVNPIEEDTLTSPLTPDTGKLVPQAPVPAGATFADVETKDQKPAEPAPPGRPAAKPGAARAARKLGLPGVTEYHGAGPERIEIIQRLADQSIVGRDARAYSAERSRTPTHVGRKRKIPVGPPPTPEPLPSVRAETGEDPRLETGDALAAVPEVDDVPTTGHDFQTHETYEAVLPGPDQQISPPEARKVASSRISMDTAEASLSSQQGKLTERSLVRLMYSAAVEEETGLLLLRRGDMVKEIYLVDGDPQFVTSNLPEELFGQYLVERGAIAEGELSLALAMLPKFDGKLGDTLVALKLLRPMAVLRHLTHQVRLKLRNAFSWEEGKYAYFNNRTSEQDAAPLGLDAFEVIGDGVMSMPIQMVERSLRDVMDSRLRSVSPTPVPPEVFRLGGQSRMAYDKLMGQLTLRELLARFDDEEQKAFFTRIIYLLVETGMARV